MIDALDAAIASDAVRGTEKAQEGGFRMTTPGAGLAGPSDLTGLASAQSYAAGMLEAFSNAASGAEAFAADLDGHGSTVRRWPR